MSFDYSATMKNLQEQLYFKHLAGTSALMGWIQRWSQIKDGLDLTNQVASLGTIPAQRFGLAWPKKKRFGKGPSLIYQKSESLWIENIQWSRARLELNQANHHSGLGALVLVSKKIQGDGYKFIDLPVFALRIPVVASHIQAWSEQLQSNVELRLYWKDEDEEHVCAPSWILPVSVEPFDAPVFTDNEAKAGLEFHELLEQRLRQSGTEANPGFQGSASLDIQDPYLLSQVKYRTELSQQRENNPNAPITTPENEAAAVPPNSSI